MTVSRVTALLRDTLLWLAALGGVACLLLAVLGQFAGFGVILFRTGSMAPAIPAGSAAFVRQVDAATLRVGDVVTVDRDGTLPVTHRVVAVGTPADAATPAVRELTLQGDANDTPDPTAYRVEHVRRVLFSVPGIAPAVARLSTPAVLVPVTVGAAALVGWALWPRTGGRGTARHRAGSGGDRTRRPADHRRTRRATLAAVVSGAVLALAAFDAAPAHAATAPAGDVVVEGGHLRLVSSGDPARMGSLGPGDSVDWVVGVIPREADTTVIRTLRSSSAGVGLTVTVDACGQRWTAASCAGSARLVDAARLPAGTDADLDIGTQGSAASWLRVRVALGSDPDEQGGVGRRTLTLVATSSGESVTTTTGDDEGTVRPSPATGRLASTGARVTALAALAGALVLGGGTLHRAARRPRGTP